MNEKSPMSRILALPKSTLAAAAVALLLFAALVVAIALGAFGGARDISVSEDGYLVVDGVKTEYGAVNKNHNFGEWQLYYEEVKDCEKKLNYRTCADCGAIEWDPGKYENHSFTTVTTAPTCTSGGCDTKTCALCGKVELVNETLAVAHNYPTEFNSDDSYHWKICDVCNGSTEREEHNFGNGETCLTCDEPIGATAGIVYEVSKDGSFAKVVGYKGEASNVRIAKQYNGIPVKAIGNSAFKGNLKIVSVTIPSGITEIGESAFYNCTSLSEIKFANSLKSIGDYAFSGCTAIKSIALPDSVNTLGREAFYSCTGIESFSFGSSVTEIGDYAFYRCLRLASVKLPDGVTTIGDSAFNGCGALASVSVGSKIANVGSLAFTGCNASVYTVYENVRYVGNAENPYLVMVGVTDKNRTSYKINPSAAVIAGGAFSGCTALTDIVIPDSVVGIGDAAFRDCSELKNVVIGNGVKVIGVAAFRDCLKLGSVTLGKGVTTVSSEAFRYCIKLNDVYYSGSEEEWAKISVSGYNSDFIRAAKHYNYAK